MVKKPVTTKTLGPLHFEDLEPKRFEDLIRGLIADFRDWYRIEGTGRSGNDEGFDIRAWEKNVQSSDEDDEGEEVKLVIEGSLWQIQCKREKSIGPSKLEDHIKESLKTEQPPYGYIFAAPVNFSKDSRDKFREIMVTNGIKEFFLWGKSDLEDMLFQRKNGSLLFIFFGISLNLEQNSKISSLKYLINNKNKLISAFGITNDMTNNLEKAVLLRDINDTTYPYNEEGTAEKVPNKIWRADLGIQLHPKGLLLNTGKHYAYIDHVKKEYDYFEDWDLRYFQDIQNDLQKRFENTEDLLDLWETIPFKLRGKIELNSLVIYEDILHIDRYGDIWYPMPHIFIEKYNEEEFFKREVISDGKNYISGYKRISFFPNSIPKHKFGKFHSDKVLKTKFIQLSHNDTGENLYFCPKGELEDIKNGETFLLEGQNLEDEFPEIYEVIDIKLEKIADMVTRGGYGMDNRIEEILARKPRKNESIKVLELRRVYKWKLDKQGKLPSLSKKMKEQVRGEEAFPGLNNGRVR